MTLFRNTANGGTNGAGATGTLSFANSTNSGVALTPVGVACTYSTTNVLSGHGPNSLRFVTPSGTSYVTSVISGGPTSMSVTYYDYIDTANTSTSEAYSLRNGTTRVSAINYSNTQKIQFHGVSSTPVYTSTTNIPVNTWFRVVLTYDASGNWTFAWYLGDSLTPIDTPASGNADFSSTGTPTIIAFGKRSGGWTGTRDMDDIAWDTNSSTPIPPTGGYVVGPLGTIAHIGDSTSSQDGNGVTDVPAMYIQSGWNVGDISFYGVGSKTLIGTDANGKTTIQNIQDARVALPQEPAVWVIGLGTNSRTATDATTLSDVTAIMNEINSIGSPGKVMFVGISQSTAGGGLDANSARRNAYIASLAGTTFPTMTWVDLDAYLRNGRDETGLWFAPPDANFAHMSRGGYILRNGFIASKARALASGSPTGLWDGQGGSALTFAAYTGSVALSGNGTLTYSAAVSAIGSRALTGSGTLALTSVPRPAQSISLGGSGTLTLSGVANYTQTLALSGSGTLSRSATFGVVASLGLSGNGVLTFATAGSGTGSLLTSGSGTLTFAATPALLTALSLSGVGALTFVPVVGTSGSRALSGSGTLTLSGSAGNAASLALGGTGTLTLVGVPKHTGGLTLTGVGVLARAAVPGLRATLNLSGGGTLVVSGTNGDDEYNMYLGTHKVIGISLGATKILKVE